MEDKKIKDEVVAAITMALSSYLGDNIHDEESGILTIFDDDVRTLAGNPCRHRLG